MIKWPVKLYARFFTFFYVFFKIQKNMTFYVFLSCCTRFPEQCDGIHQCRNVDLAVVSVLVELDVMLSNYMTEFGCVHSKEYGSKTDP